MTPKTLKKVNYLTGFDLLIDNELVFTVRGLTIYDKTKP